MKVLIPWLWAAGALQLMIIAANFVVPKKLDCRENLSRVSPMVRTVFVVHWVYIVLVLGIFASLSFWFAPDLAGASRLGRFLSAMIAVFWLLRVPIQLFFYDREMREAEPCWRRGLPFCLFLSGGSVQHRRAGSRAMSRNALVGGLLWVCVAAGSRLHWACLNTIELLFLLGPLVVVPLGLGLSSRSTDTAHGGLPIRIARRLQLPAAICVVASFWLAQGFAATVLTLPWFVLGCIVGLAGLTDMVHGKVLS